MFYCLLWILTVLCRTFIADRNSVRNAYISPQFPEIERGSTLNLLCFMGYYDMPYRNASHIIWKLNQNLIAQENYNIINETVCGVTIHNFTDESAHVKCLIKYPDKEQLLVHTKVKSGFPPSTPRNISCIYHYDVKFTCSWIPGKETYLSTKYTLIRKRPIFMDTDCDDICQTNQSVCYLFYPFTDPDYVNVTEEEEKMDFHSIQDIKSVYTDTRKNITCIYYYNDYCVRRWTARKVTYLKETKYAQVNIQDQNLMDAFQEDTCQSSNGSCSFFPPYTPVAEDYCCQVKAENVLGVGISDCIPINTNTIVKTKPPKIVSVETIAGVKQLLNITWDKPDPTSFDLNCRLRYRKTNSNNSVIAIFNVTQNRRTTSFNLTELSDFTEYAIAIQCVIIESEIWSEWSQEKIGRTEQQAPSRKVDLWRIIESSPSAADRYVHLMWKVSKECPSSEFLLSYKIQYCPENNASFKMTHNTTDKMATLFLTGEAYVISVVAYNLVGESPEATLRIPSIGEKSSKLIDTMRTFTLNERMVVEWESSVSEVSKYVIEWYEELETKPSARSWQYISNITRWTAQKDAFKPFICYNISVYPLYGNKIGTPNSIQAFIQEGRPSVGPVAKTDNLGKNGATIRWKKIPKDKRNGFIVNYTIFYKPEGGKELNETVMSDVMQYKLKSLQANTQYTAYVMAATKAGGTYGNRITFSTLKFSDDDLIFITIPFGLCMILLLILGTTCTLKKHMVKNVCWPDIPDPAKSIAGKWPTDVHKNNPSLKEVQSEDGTVHPEDISVLESCFPDEDHSALLVKGHENYDSKHTNVCIKDMDKEPNKILYGKAHKVVKPLSLSSPYIVTEQTLLSALMPTRKIQNQQLEISREGLCESQHSSIENSKENERDQVLEPTDFKEETKINPYLKNSVTTREFLISENLPEYNMEAKKQLVVLAPLQQNTIGQSYVTLNMFGLSTADQCIPAKS
uniref:Interleukin 31 receptor A n=1 Tax=Pelodiscus sinensis TaxID=13735 RepID=K7GI45_PELSI|nr:interleukin-31 receptor subunit alpha [Pelodiscus sinensis]XP_006139619.1 interleukin-31 receptor subunit alpha [Pelodiscus sinensis]XP_006139621.1 interleukin-31 receptor subunit alpha [Pelodiscus sinensis]XP_006139622.1 interleukin-31 receptor subunit alpha [Pelodiscus sinensis]XP_014437250.1 interleukin-31 receptor subunit alpha [Pelodiscus sinensis]XP_025035455.1 interleukin-31 receptor subunit alpha [Pelodiscus sinensis]|eukprot:XP_006139618.1 interleukin-31 receptor subunit alpha [Pelodiscus sinensis]